MNQSYECQSCQNVFSGPERERCIVCGSSELREIAPLAERTVQTELDLTEDMEGNLTAQHYIDALKRHRLN